MRYADDLRRCLAECDVAGMRKLSAHVFPHLPQPQRDVDVLARIHHARTQSASMTLKQRAYSHRWLVDRGLPSGLPDELKPRAERIYPVTVESVGIASLTQTPITPVVHGAMSDAVLDCYADKRTEPTIVKARMMEVRARTIKQLLG